MFANERDYYSYYTANSFATCTPCKQGDWLCGAGKWWCDINNTATQNVQKSIKKDVDRIGGTSNAIQTNLRKDMEKDPILGASHHIQTSLGFKKPSGGGSDGGTKASKNCGGCDAGNWGCELGKLSCEFTKALGDAGNSTFDVFGKYMPYFMIGGAAIIAILLIKR